MAEAGRDIVHLAEQRAFNPKNRVRIPVSPGAAFVTFPSPTKKFKYTMCKPRRKLTITPSGRKFLKKKIIPRVTTPFLSALAKSRIDGKSLVEASNPIELSPAEDRKLRGLVAYDASLRKLGDVYANLVNRQIEARNAAKLRAAEKKEKREARRLRRKPEVKPRPKKRPAPKLEKLLEMGKTIPPATFRPWSFFYWKALRRKIYLISRGPKPKSPKAKKKIRKQERKIQQRARQRALARKTKYKSQPRALPVLKITKSLHNLFFVLLDQSGKLVFSSSVYALAPKTEKDRFSIGAFKAIGRVLATKVRTLKARKVHVYTHSLFNSKVRMLINSLTERRIFISTITDRARVPHNGMRPKKARNQR